MAAHSSPSHILPPLPSQPLLEDPSPNPDPNSHPTPESTMDLATASSPSSSFGFSRYNMRTRGQKSSSRPTTAPSTSRTLSTKRSRAVLQHDGDDDGDESSASASSSSLPTSYRGRSSLGLSFPRSSKRVSTSTKSKRGIKARKTTSSSTSTAEPATPLHAETVQDSAARSDRIKLHSARLAMIVNILNAPVSVLEPSFAEDSSASIPVSGRGPIQWAFFPPPLVLAPSIYRFLGGERLEGEMRSCAEKGKASVDCTRAATLLRTIETTLQKEGRGEDMKYVCRALKRWASEGMTQFGALINVASLILCSHPSLLRELSIIFLPPGNTISSSPIAGPGPCPSALSRDPLSTIDSLDPLFQRLSCAELKEIQRREGIKPHEGEFQYQVQCQAGVKGSGMGVGGLETTLAPAMGAEGMDGDGEGLELRSPSRSRSGSAQSDKMDLDSPPSSPAGSEEEEQAAKEVRGERAYSRVGGTDGGGEGDVDSDAEWWLVSYSSAIASAYAKVWRRGVS